MTELTVYEQKISDEAVQYVKLHEQEIITFFTQSSQRDLEKPVTFFTAGSPGAGKTEFAYRLINAFVKNSRERMVHIDADAIRSLLPGYVGSNSYLFQRAAVRAVHTLFNQVLHEKQSCVLDGTFARYDFAQQNIQRCLDRGRVVIVTYLYQDPLDAWHFTQAREKVEGRHIDKDKFIEQFFASYESIKKVQKDFGDKIDIWYVTRDIQKNTYHTNLDFSRVDSGQPLKYSKEELVTLLV